MCVCHVVSEHVFDWNIFILNMAFLRLPVFLYRFVLHLLFVYYYSSEKIFFFFFKNEIGVVDGNLCRMTRTMRGLHLVIFLCV